jgi:hypothetical protein
VLIAVTVSHEVVKSEIDANATVVRPAPLTPEGVGTSFRLELDAADEAIRGRVTAESGRAMPFVGWSDLAAAIELATSGGSMRDEPS